MRVGHITLAMALASSTPASNIFVITVEDKIRNRVARKPNGSMRLVWILLLGFSLLSLAHPAAAQNTWMSAGHPVPLWSNSGAWSLGMVPNGSTDISIPDGAVGGDVSFANRNTLTIGAPATLTLLSPTTVTNSGGSGLINNSGSFANYGTLFNELGGQLNNSGTLDNFGTLSNRISGLVVNTANLNNQSGGLLINDLSSTIQNDHSIANEAGATLSNSGTLNGSGFLVNFGTADNFGQLKNVVFNAGGTINNSGGSLLMGDGSVILGGTLNNAAGTLGVTGGTGPIITATLDGSTGYGAVTIQGTYTGDVHSITNLLGTINNQGNIQSLHSGGLNVTGAATLQGGGAVTLTAMDAHLGNQSATLTNVDNTIQGFGSIIFHNAENQAGGTINANVSHQELGFSATTMTNAGLLEATNGGFLRIGDSSINNAGGKMVADGGRLQMFATSITGGTLTALNGGTLSMADGHTQGGTITALNGGLVDLGASFHGEGETVTAMTGGTVQLSAGATISGGTLNNVSGTLGTLAHDTATLDGSTGFGAVTIQGTYTAGFASRTNLLGTINNQGNIQVNLGDLILLGDTALQGGGAVILGNSGNAVFGSSSPLYTLTNVDNTIQGAGILGFKNLVNESGGTINANMSGQTLSLGGTMTNAGLLEATNGGILEFGAVINNAGGTIAALDGGIVNMNDATVMGGTLNNVSGTLRNLNLATLDGSTAAGAVTIQGTFTGRGETTLLGTINNQGTMQVLSTGSLRLSGDTILQGGGTVTLANSAVIHALAPGTTLTNVDNTIQGAGGFSGIGAVMQIVNQAGGTILANSPGNLMVIHATPLTNAGTVQVNAGSELQIIAPFTQTGGRTQVDGTMRAILGESVSGGIVEGTGTIFGDVMLSGGTIEPGDVPTPGTLAIFGTYDQTNALFDELISSTDNGLLTAEGVTLGPGADLNIDLLGGFTPTFGQTFTIMEFVSLSGAFENAPGGDFTMDGFQWSIAYEPGDIKLTFESSGGTPPPVPEPSSYILLATAVISIINGGKLRTKLQANRY